MTLDPRTKLGITAIAIVVLAASLMQAGTLRVYGLAPNVVLVALVVFSLFSENAVFYLLLTLIASLFVRATPVIFDGLAVATFLVGVLAFLIERWLVWPGPVGVAILTAGGTALTYAIIEPSFIWTHGWLLLAETLYNVALGLALFEVVQFFFGRALRR